MKLQEQDVRQEGSVSRPEAAFNPLSPVCNYIYKTLVIAEVEVRKMMHDVSEPLTRAVQPTLWLLIFGQVFTRTHVMPTGSISYLEFMVPGILAQSVLFVSIFSGMAVIWERDLGTATKLLVSPTPRTALVLGKALSAGVRTLPQIAIIYVLCLFLHIHLHMSLLSVLGVLTIIALGAALFSTFSLMIACIVRSRERFMGIGQVLTMPLFFASNAIYPISLMPPWLQTVSKFNPLTYQVDALRGLMLGIWNYNLALDYAVLAGTTFVLTMLCGRLYYRVAA